MTTPAPGAYSVLIIDDDADDRFLTERLVTKSGVRAIFQQAGSGAEAIRLLEATLAHGTGPKVLLVDLKMPRPDGFEITRWVRSQKALRDTRVVILTNSADPEDRTRALQLGADRYLVKNPTPREIAAVFHEILQP